MALIPDTAVLRQRVAALPLETYQAGETVLTAGSKAGRLLILKKGAVAIVKGATEIAKVTEPGAVLGEVSALLDHPHTADVRTLETSQFHVADASGARACAAHDGNCRRPEHSVYRNLSAPCKRRELAVRTARARRSDFGRERERRRAGEPRARTPDASDSMTLRRVTSSTMAWRTGEKGVRARAIQRRKTVS